jgi:hypothetical protein
VQPTSRHPPGLEAGSTVAGGALPIGSCVRKQFDAAYEMSHMGPRPLRPGITRLEMRWNVDGCSCQDGVRVRHRSEPSTRDLARGWESACRPPMASPRFWLGLTRALSGLAANQCASQFLLPANGPMPCLPLLQAYGTAVTVRSMEGPHALQG